jgi:hypothetical protein
MEGTLILETKDQILELQPGRMATVPADVAHRTYPAGATLSELNRRAAGYRNHLCLIGTVTKLTLNTLDLQVVGTPSNVRASLNGTFYPAQLI